MFAYGAFNQSVERWNLSSAITIEGMFSYSAFEGSLLGWSIDVSEVEMMEFLYCSEKSLKAGVQDLSFEEALALDRERYLKDALENTSASSQERLRL